MKKKIPEELKNLPHAEKLKRLYGEDYFSRINKKSRKVRAERGTPIGMASASKRTRLRVAKAGGAGMKRRAERRNAENKTKGV